MGDPGVEGIFTVEPMIHRQRRVAGLADKHVALPYPRTIGQGVVESGRVEPAAGVAGDDAAAAIGPEPLHIEAGAVVFGLVDVGKEIGIVDDRPIDRRAVLQRVTHLSPA
ncbi:hypothetical protein D3C80_1826110 [compost metagenome]